MYARRQPSMRTWASSRVSQRSRLRHASRRVPWKDSTAPFSQGLPGAIKRVVTPTRCSQSRTAVAVNSGPLSDRREVGGPRATKRGANRASTSSLRSRRATSRRRHARVYASTMARIRSGRPSAVRSKTKAWDQTWRGRSARRRISEPSASQRRPRWGCFAGTRQPSWRHSRATRVGLTRQPS